METGSVEAAFQDMPQWPGKGNYVTPAVDSYEAAMRSGSLSTWTGSNEPQKVFAHNPAYNSSSINRIVNNLQQGVSNVDVYKPILPQAWNNSSPPKQQQYGKTFKKNYITTSMLIFILTALFKFR